MKAFRPTLLLIFPLLLFGTGLPSQDVEQEQDVPFRVEVDAVNVLTTVHDKDTRKFVTDLTKENFEIYEDDLLQQIEHGTGKSAKHLVEVLADAL